MEINSNNVKLTSIAEKHWNARTDSVFLAEDFLLFHQEVMAMTQLFDHVEPNLIERLDSLQLTKKYKAVEEQREKWEDKEEVARTKYLQALTELAYTKLSSSDSSHKDMVWWQNEIKMLNKQVKNKNLHKSRMASRTLGMIMAGCAESIWSYAGKNDIETAINLTKIWLYIQPEMVWPNWTAVRIYAINKNKKSTIKYINKSMELGITPTNAMLSNPNFDFIRSSKTFQSLEALMK
jgi:hypothetical protein